MAQNTCSVPDDAMCYEKSTSSLPFILSRGTRILILTVSLTLFIKCSLCTDEPPALNDLTFHSFMETSPISFILFYAPWCMWSKRVMPFFKDAQHLVKNQNLQVQLATLDASRYFTIGDYYNVTSFPTFLLFIDNATHVYDSIPYSSSDLVKWLVSRLNSQVTVNTTEQFNLFEKNHEHIPVVVGMFKDNTTQDYAAFVKASQYTDAWSFVVTHNISVIQEIVEKYNSTNTLQAFNESASEFCVLIKPNAVFTSHIESPLVPYVELPLNANHLVQFAKNHTLPLISHLQNNEQSIFPQHKSFLYILFAGANDQHGHLNASYVSTYHVAKEFSDQFFFTYCDGSQRLHKRLAGALNVDTLSESSTVRVARIQRNYFGRPQIQYQYNPPESLSETWDVHELRVFLTNVVKGTIKPFIKSEPIPDPHYNTGPLLTLVALEFERLIYDSPHDVLLEIYAPWCGHCRQLEKTFRNVAAVLEPASHIRVMKIDATLNEIPIFIVGYPTILFFTPNVNYKPMEGILKKNVDAFQGERSLDKLLAWVNQHTSKPINIDKLLETYKKNHPEENIPRSSHYSRVFDEL